MPHFVEILVRGGAAAIFLVTACVLLRDGGGRTVARLGAFFALAAAARSLFTDPILFRWAMPWNAPLVLLCFGTAAGLWLFAEALFDDDFRLRRRHFAAAAVMGGLGAVIFAGLLRGDPWQGPKAAHEAGECLLALLALRAAWRGRGVDLVEPRRRARILFVSVASLLLFIVATTEFAARPSRLPAIVTDLNVLGLLAVAIGLAMSVVGIRSQEMFQSKAGRMWSGPSPADEHAIGCTDAAEARLMIRLERIMAEGRAYRESGLTIGGLAARLGTAEYLLRRLINGRLGWRNFNAYLNAWRLAEARDALQDPAQSEVPVSTIALDAGFQSLGPFNRAFRSTEGLTPTEYRQRALQPHCANLPSLRLASRK